MSVYGVTPQGFVRKPAAVIAAEVDADLKGILGESAGTEPDGSIPPSGFAGQLKAMMVDREAGHWDLMQAVVSSLDTRANSGEAQDATGMLTGSTRERARQSTTVETCTGDPGTFLQQGRAVTVAVTGSRFASDVDATIVALPAWLPTHAYLVGDRVTNASRAYACIIAGNSAGAGGPTTTALDIIDGAVHWRYLGEGTGAIDVPYTAVVAGPIGALSGALNTIATPVGGWRTAVNVLDAKVGANLESSTAFRFRRDAELTAEGASVPEAIRARVLKVGEFGNNPVIACRVFHNDTDLVDANGLPPHSVEVVVLGGDDDTSPVAGISSDPLASVAAAVFASVGAGIRSVGTTAVTVIDSLGNPQVVRFTRPAQIDIWVTMTVYYDALQWPQIALADQEALVRAAALSALLTYADTPIVGKTVRTAPLIAAVIDGPSATDALGAAVFPAPEGSPAAPGILDVSPIFIGVAAFPGSSAPIPITPRQIAVFDSSRIVITALPEAP